ncbi:MAG: hypothetical protein ACKPE6_14615, partial [Gammaproteobacteria bacterium]
SIANNRPQGKILHCLCAAWTILDDCRHIDAASRRGDRAAMMACVPQAHGVFAIQHLLQQYWH